MPHTLPSHESSRAPSRIRNLKRDARQLARATGLPLAAALDQMAARHGHARWADLMRQENTRTELDAAIRRSADAVLRARQTADRRLRVLADERADPAEAVLQAFVRAQARGASVLVLDGFGGWLGDLAEVLLPTDLMPPALVVDGTRYLPPERVRDRLAPMDEGSFRTVADILTDLLDLLDITDIHAIGAGPDQRAADLREVAGSMMRTALAAAAFHEPPRDSSGDFLPSTLDAVRQFLSLEAMFREADAVARSSGTDTFLHHLLAKHCALLPGFDPVRRGHQTTPAIDHHGYPLMLATQALGMLVDVHRGVLAPRGQGFTMRSALAQGRSVIVRMSDQETESGVEVMPGRLALAATLAHLRRRVPAVPPLLVLGECWEAIPSGFIETVLGCAEVVWLSRAPRHRLAAAAGMSEGALASLLAWRA